MKYALMAFLATALAACCTCSMTMVTTRGTASDVVDETQTQSPQTTASPTVEVPLKTGL